MTRVLGVDAREAPCMPRCGVHILLYVVHPHHREVIPCPVPGGLFEEKELRGRRNQRGIIVAVEEAETWPQDLI